ncbi:MAG: orotidine-5'-phosphate decarboxylase, partial [Acidimicrobiales bacterium]
CPGIDPSPAALAQWGLEDSADGARQFALRYLDALGEQVAVMKPNVAFFEQHGAPGVAALESFLAAARDSAVLTIVDAKRGDIASTAAAYARAWLGEESALRADAVTVSPYLGAAALAPFYETADAHGRGVFVVVRSSNPEGRGVQQSRTADGRALEEALLDEVANRPGTVGAVIGLIAGAEPLGLPDQGFYLAPGLESQGAGLGDLAAQFAGIASSRVVVNLSRSLASAGPDPQALREAAARAQARIESGLRPASG